MAVSNAEALLQHQQLHFDALAQYVEMLDTQQFAGIDAARANRIYQALQLALVSVDAAMVVAGEFDWMDERSRRWVLRQAVP